MLTDMSSCNLSYKGMLSYPICRKAQLFRKATIQTNMHMNSLRGLSNKAVKEKSSQPDTQSYRQFQREQAYNYISKDWT